MKKNNSFILLGCFLYTFFISSVCVNASTLGFSPTKNNASVGDTIRVRVMVGGNTQPINAVSGTVSFPTDTLRLTNVSKSGSIVTLWAQDPTYSNASGTASFEGVILAGFSQSSGTILNLSFKVLKEGTAVLSLRDGSVLAHDGVGTNVLTGKGSASIAIQAAAKKDETRLPPADSTPGIVIEDIANNDPLARTKRFLITSSDPSITSYTIQVDNLDIMTWDDDGSHIFETPALAAGSHTITVKGTDANGKVIAGYHEFKTTSIQTPVVTDYSQNMTEGQYLVVKGMADPLTTVNVAITPDGQSSTTSFAQVMSSTTGSFIYTSEQPYEKGSYVLTFKARTKDGVESESSAPLRIMVTPHLPPFAQRATTYLSVVIPLVALVLLLIATIIFGWYQLRKYRKMIIMKLTRAENGIEKDFSTIEEQLDMEFQIIKKIKSLNPLTDMEKMTLVDIKKAIQKAERAMKRKIIDTKRDI